MAASQHCSADKRGWTTRTDQREQLRPIALLETPLQLIKSVAVDQHADHITALMQEQQVEFRVRDGAEAMINAVRKFLKNDTNRILMQGDICECVWLNQQIVSAEGGEETHPLPGPAVCFSVCERWKRLRWVIQERGENGKRCELHNSVAGAARHFA